MAKSVLLRFPESQHYNWNQTRDQKSQVFYTEVKSQGHWSDRDNRNLRGAKLTMPQAR